LRFPPLNRGGCQVLGCESRPPIGEAATDHAFDDQICALPVVHVAGVVAQIELAAVAAKVGFAKVVIGADHAALEDREEVFGGVGVLEAARGDVFAGRVIDNRVTVKLAAHAGVNGGLVGHEVRGTVNVGHDQPAQVLGIDVGNVERAGLTVALDKGDNGLLRGRLAVGAVLSLAANIGFIGLTTVLGPPRGPFPSA
jgi:hypothetical protein